MLFHSTLRKELARSFGATLVVLATVVMTMMLIRTLGQASRGAVNPSDVMMVMGYTVLGHLPTILTLSLFVSIVGTLSRMYRDSEMAIWFASGRGLASFVSPLFRFAWPVLLVIALLALVGWPWSNQQVQDMKDHYEKRGDIERIAPGQFQESASGTRVFFVDKQSNNAQSGNNVLIAANEHGKEAITSARSARVETVGDQRFVLLSNGQRMEQSNADHSIKLSDFDEYGTLIEGAVLGDQEAGPTKALSTLALLRDPNPPNLGELAWRLGLAMAGFNFVILALAVSVVNPRAGRTGSLVFALFAFVVYYNFINLGQNWIAVGSISAPAFMLLLHGGASALGLALLTKRHYNWSWRQLWQRRAADASECLAQRRSEIGTP
ncbi:MAG: LPS export ABC transporter permease LptF [Curvibacter sp.]|nr:LPS export ABC transporter permease LptF [Curvibacter sp.]